MEDNLKIASFESTDLTIIYIFGTFKILVLTTYATVTLVPLI